MKWTCISLPLTPTKNLKKLIYQPNKCCGILARPNQKTRLKMIAKRFGVSEMQIRRIKSAKTRVISKFKRVRRIKTLEYIGHDLFYSK